MQSSEDEDAAPREESDDAINDEHGFLDTKRPAGTEPFSDGSGVDVFVDGIRGLPDSAGASRVTVRLYAQGENIGAVSYTHLTLPTKRIV